MSRTFPWCSRARPVMRDSCICGEVWLAADICFVSRCVRRDAATITRPIKRPMLQARPATVKKPMIWYGKLLGALLGALIGRGWLGALIGFLIGHQFDRQ